MAKIYDLAVFVGRFQLFHEGQRSVITLACNRAKKVLIFVGSATSARSHRNPFTYEERSQMILNSLTIDERKKVIIKPLEDSSYNDAKWIENVQEGVDNVVRDEGMVNPSIALIGHNKDNTSYYLKLFPQWESIEAPNYHGFNSTQIRNAFFSNIGEMWLANADGHRIGDHPLEKVITSATREFLLDFIKKPEYKTICDEYEFILAYRSGNEVGKPIRYPVIMVTVDAIVVQSGHVLVIRRRSAPGKGLWAMPGGFLEPDEYIIDGMLRELTQETKLKVPEAVLKGSIVAKDVFDNPTRSSRGRVITHAYLIKLRDDDTLPRVKGSDDADKAKWVPFSQLTRDNMFEDHYDILINMLGRI